MSHSFCDMAIITLNNLTSEEINYKLEQDVSNGLKLSFLLDKVHHNLVISRKGKILWKCFIALPKHFNFDISKYIPNNHPIYPISWEEPENNKIGLRACSYTGNLRNYYEDTLNNYITIFKEISQNISRDLLN